jgi:hypothetical protein
MKCSFVLLIWAGAVCVGAHRMQPRAGAGRAVSAGDGMRSGCVVEYVRRWIFLLKRTPFVGAAFFVVAGAISVAAASGGCCSLARAGAESADSSEAKRFARCSGAIFLRRAMRAVRIVRLMRIWRCAARMRRDECGGCGSDAGGVNFCCTIAEYVCDFEVCPLATEPMRLFGPAGPPSLFLIHWCSREHSGLLRRT